jgi:hypothetical protein
MKAFNMLRHIVLLYQYSLQELGLKRKIKNSNYCIILKHTLTQLIQQKVLYL